MPFVEVPNTAQVEIRGTYFGEFVENTLYYEFGSIPSQGDLQDLVDAIQVPFASSWLPLLPAEWIAREIYARSLDTQFAPQAVNIVDAGDPGSRGSGGMPGSVTAAIKRSSGLTGRSTRGRIYWMGLIESDITGNSINPTLLSSILTALVATDVAAVTNGWSPVIVSRQQNGVALSSGITYPITLWSVTDAFVDSQRKRLAGRGN